MKTILNIYENNKLLIDNFIFTTLGRLSIEQLTNKTANSIFDTVECVRIAYSVGENYSVNSPYYYRNKIDDTKIGLDKEYYFMKSNFNKNNEFLSIPYISAMNGGTNITYASKISDGYLVVDLDIVLILERLKLIQSNKIARIINNYVYGFIGFSLLFFSIFLGLYAIGTFISSIIDNGYFNIDSIFKSIIALTLGLAIFDLSKTILEQEIFFKNISHSEGSENKIFSKFLISIIIALSIEALMVVFKIALNDYTGMIHGFLLIFGVSIMIYAVGKYNFFTKS